MQRRLIRPISIVILMALAAALAWTAARGQAQGAAGAGEKPGAAAKAGGDKAGGDKKAAPRAPAAELQAVDVRTDARSLEALGSLKPSRVVQVRTQTAGRIIALNFKDGDAVRAGQLLIQLDDTLPRAQLAQARARLQLAESQAKRQQGLLAEGFISRNAIDQSQSSVVVARADVQVAQANVDQLRVLAPFSGVVGLRQVNVGDVLPAGTSAVTLQAMSPLWVDFPVNEGDVTAVQPGQALRLRLDALPGQTLAGRVLTTDTALGTQDRALVVRGQVDNARGLLKPGMFARVTLELGQQPATTWVNEAALVSAQGRQWLFVAAAETPKAPEAAKADAAKSDTAKPGDRPGGEGPTVKVRPLQAQIGLRRQGQVQILSGLAAGDRVVVAGQGALTRQLGTPAAQQGLPVRVVSLKALLDAAGDTLNSPPPAAVKTAPPK